MSRKSAELLHSTNQEEGTVPPEQADLRVFDENRRGKNHCFFKVKERIRISLLPFTFS